jgi:serine/threonine-protein kinase
MSEGEADPRIGTVIDGRYRLVEQLALGGMGVIYRAEHIKVARPVAIKFPHQALAVNQDFVRRFQREAAALSRLTHPNIVSVVDYGVANNNVPYLAMEFHRGRSLGDLLEEGPLAARRAVGIARQMLSGLRHAHEASVVHRDLKPDNMLLLSDVEGDFVKILDFGLAKILLDDAPGGAPITSTGLAMGTLGYMSPEQFRGQAVDARADIYSVGVVLYQMITGRRPFIADQAIDLLKLQTEQDPPPPRKVGGAGCCSDELEKVILRALARDLERRYANAGAFSEALEDTPEGRTFNSNSLWELTPPPVAAVPPKVIRAPGPPSLPDPSLPSLPSIPVGRPLPGMPPVRDASMPLLSSNLPGLAPPPAEIPATVSLAPVMPASREPAPRRGGRLAFVMALMLGVIGGVGFWVWRSGLGRSAAQWALGHLVQGDGSGKAVPPGTPAAKPGAGASGAGTGHAAVNVPGDGGSAAAPGADGGAGAGAAPAGSGDGGPAGPEVAAGNPGAPGGEPGGEGPGGAGAGGPDSPEGPDAPAEVEQPFPADSPGIALEKTRQAVPVPAPTPARPRPTSPAAALRDVNRVFASGRIDEAVEILYAARRQWPDVPSLGLWLGHAYYRKHWRTDALREYTWVLKQRPDLKRDPIVRRNVVNSLEGSTYRAASAILVGRIGKVALPEVRRLFNSKDAVTRRRARAVAARLLAPPRAARPRPGARPAHKKPVRR